MRSLRGGHLAAPRCCPVQDECNTAKSTDNEKGGTFLSSPCSATVMGGASKRPESTPGSLRRSASLEQRQAVGETHGRVWKQPWLLNTCH